MRYYHSITSSLLCLFSSDFLKYYNIHKRNVFDAKPSIVKMENALMKKKVEKVAQYSGKLYPLNFNTKTKNEFK